MSKGISRFVRRLLRVSETGRRLFLCKPLGAVRLMVSCTPISLQRQFQLLSESAAESALARDRARLRCSGKTVRTTKCRTVMSLHTKFAGRHLSKSPKRCQTIADFGRARLSCYYCLTVLIEKRSRLKRNTRPVAVITNLAERKNFTNYRGNTLYASEPIPEN